MKNLVTIRLYGGGLRLRLDPNATFHDIRSEAARKFSEGRSFFKDAAVAVTFEGRALSDTEEELLVDAITNNSDLDVLCICSEDPQTMELFARAVHRVGEDAKEEERAHSLPSDAEAFHVHTGDIADNEVIESSLSILVTGSVRAGCAVVSSRNIVILGGLYGQASAGDSAAEGEESGHYIYTGDFMPEKVHVDGIRYRGKTGPRLIFKQKSEGPKICLVKDGVVIAADPAGGDVNV